MEKRYLNPPETHNMPQFYSQAVVVTEGGLRTVYVSGQVSADEKGHLVGEGDLAAQAEQVFSNMNAVLGSAGVTTADVVKINAYVVDLDGQKAATVGGAMLNYFPGPEQPASTWIGVSSLLGRGYLLEVEAVAVVKG